MALINCDECEGKISAKAGVCLHCGTKQGIIGMFRRGILHIAGWILSFGFDLVIYVVIGMTLAAFGYYGLR